MVRALPFIPQSDRVARGASLLPTQPSENHRARRNGIAKHDAVVRRLYQNDTMLSATYGDESTMDITQNVIITAYVFLIVTTSVCRMASFKARRRSKLIAVAVHEDTGYSV